MSITGCYTTHLYCNDPEHQKQDVGFERYRLLHDHHMIELTGETYRETIALAKKYRWYVNRVRRKDFCLCPLHNHFCRGPAIEPRPKPLSN